MTVTHNKLNLSALETAGARAEQIMATWPEWKRQVAKKLVSGPAVTAGGDYPACAIASVQVERLTKELEEARVIVRVLEAELHHAQAESHIVFCNTCEQTNPISQLTFIQDQHYISPYSCTGGDYWLPCSINFAKCTCGQVIRLISVPELEVLNKLGHLFKERITVNRYQGPYIQYRNPK